MLVTVPKNIFGHKKPKEIYYAAVAVGTACVIGVVSAATEVDRREDNKMKREPKRRKKKNIYSIWIDDYEEMGLKM